MDRRAKPVVVIWLNGDKGNERYESKHDAALALGTSVSHLSRLIETGRAYRVGDRLCCVDELLDALR